MSIYLDKQFNSFSLELFLVCASSIIVTFISHYIGLPILILISVCIMCAGILFLPNNKKLPILFCALPWIQILKLNYMQPTLYHLLYLVFFLTILLKEKKMNLELLLLILIISIYVISNRMFNQGDLEFGFIAYLISLLFMAVLFPNFKKYYEPILCAEMFSLGLLTGFIAERIYRNIPSMYVYLSSDTYAPTKTALRFAGLANDPNFMAMQVLMYLCFVINIIENKIISNKRKIILCLSSLVITIFSFFTVSKMFYLGLIFILLFIVLNKIKEFNIVKIVQISIITCLGIYVFYSIGFFDGILYRLELGSGLDIITTGRYSIFIMYINYILNNPYILLFGVGMKDRLYYNGISTHNTLITFIYQLGIIGFVFIYIPLILALLKSIVKSYSKNIHNKNYGVLVILLLCMMCLDFLMYEGLPLLIIITVTSFMNQFHNKDRNFCKK